MTVQEYFGDWYKCLNPTELNKVIARVRPMYINQNCIIYPRYKEVFRAFPSCNYHDLKVVFVGMDPYNNGSAIGLAFANQEGTATLSPSLQVIKDCLVEHYFPKREQFDVTLESWARQGVLLLNSALTVEKNKPGSHSMIWRNFISSFLHGLGQWQTGIIYVLLGVQAQSFKPYIGRFNDVIECKHPAYYARNNKSMPNIFADIDRLTWSKNKTKITWI